VFTISQAARIAGVHRNTVRRYLDAGKFPGAFREDRAAPWQIPISELIAAGLKIRAPSTRDPEGQQRDRALRDMQRQIDSLAAQVHDLTRRAESAEALLAERERRIEDLQRAMLLLETRGLQPAKP
jgi:peptidoglycan hydrolase CwlO-like protein